MKFTVTSGNPTSDELLALKAALDQHKIQNLKPVIKSKSWLKLSLLHNRLLVVVY